MKAVFCEKYGAPEVLKVIDIEQPEPKANEVLIEIHASSITTADSMMRQGNPCYARLFLGLRRPKKPVTGTGFAGTVSRKGDQVSQFEIGDPVFGETTVDFGANAEYVCLAEDGIILHKPDFLSFEEAAVLCDGPVTSFNFLKNLAQVEADQHVLINGASGSLGVAAIQIAKQMGAFVTGVCSHRNMELVRSLGADDVIDYGKEDFTQKRQQYDVIFDTIGKSSFSACKPALTASGKYLSAVLSLPLLFQCMMPFSNKKKSAKFAATGLSPVGSIKSMVQELLQMIRDGQMKIVIDRLYPIEQIRDAHAYIETGRKKGNVVLQLAPEKSVFFL